MQLSDVLCIDGCDVDQIIHNVCKISRIRTLLHVITQVTQLFNEQQQLKMRLETLTHSSQATELDAKANRCARACGACTLTVFTEIRYCG